MTLLSVGVLVLDIVCAGGVPGACGGSAAGGDVAVQANFCGPDAATNVEIGSCTSDASAGAGGTSVVIGNAASNTAADAVCIGEGTVCASAGAVCIGSDCATGTGAGSVVIGDGAAGSNTANARSVSIGQGAAVGAFAVAIGGDAACAPAESTIVGSAANVACSATRVTGMGIGISITSQGNIALGYGASDAGATDTFVAGGTTEAMSNVYFGKGVTNATPTFYALRGTRGTGTNIAGGGLGLYGGNGTGTGAGGNVSIATSEVLTTGTTEQTSTDRVLYVAKAKTLVDNTATTFVQCSIPSDSTTFLHIDYSVEAENATDQQIIGGTAHIPVYNDAGTEVCGTVTEVGEVSAASTGTITSTITCVTTPTNAIDIQLASDSSLNVTPILTYSIRKNGGVGSCTPQ